MKLSNSTKIVAIIVGTTLVSIPFISKPSYASGNIISSASQVNVGESFTLTVNTGPIAAWNIHVSTTGPVSSGCAINKADVTDTAMNEQQSFSVSCAAQGEGTITATLTGDITTEDEKTTKLSESINISVIKLQTPPENPPADQPTENVDNQNNENQQRRTEEPQNTNNQQQSTNTQQQPAGNQQQSVKQNSTQKSSNARQTPSIPKTSEKTEDKKEAKEENNSEENTEKESTEENDKAPKERFEIDKETEDIKTNNNFWWVWIIIGISIIIAIITIIAIIKQEKGKKNNKENSSKKQKVNPESKD